jgi:hypothetical protein
MPGTDRLHWAVVLTTADRRVRSRDEAGFGAREEQNESGYAYPERTELLQNSPEITELGPRCGH